MNPVLPETQSLQDEHLDLMLRLAYRRAAGEEIEQLLAESERAFTPEEEAQAQAGYALFLKKLALLHPPRKSRRRFAYLIEVAACVVLLLGVSLSFAVAKVDVIRSKVLEMIIELNEDHAAISLLPLDELEFEVPAGYMGDYFPSYIPEGYELSWISKYYGEVRYFNSDTQLIQFGEDTSATVVSLSVSDDAVFSTISLNGVEATLIEEPPVYKDGELYRSERYHVIWTIEDRFFHLTVHESRETAIEIAASVRKIVK